MQPCPLHCQCSAQSCRPLLLHQRWSGGVTDHLAGWLHISLRHPRWSEKHLQLLRSSAGGVSEGCSFCTPPSELQSSPTPPVEWKSCSSFPFLPGWWSGRVTDPSWLAAWVAGVQPASKDWLVTPPLPLQRWSEKRLQVFHSTIGRVPRGCSFLHSTIVCMHSVSRRWGE